jgi:hypothetical protein
VASQFVGALVASAFFGWLLETRSTGGARG